MWWQVRWGQWLPSHSCCWGPAAKKRLQALCQYRVFNHWADMKSSWGTAAMGTIFLWLSFSDDDDDDDGNNNNNKHNHKQLTHWTPWPCRQSLKIQRSRLLSPSTRHSTLSHPVKTGQVLFIIAGGLTGDFYFLLRLSFPIFSIFYMRMHCFYTSKKKKKNTEDHF